MKKIILVLIWLQFLGFSQCEDKKNTDQNSVVENKNVIKAVTTLLDHNDEYFGNNQKEIFDFFKSYIFDIPPFLYKWNKVIKLLYTTMKSKVLVNDTESVKWIYLYTLFYHISNYIDMETYNINGKYDFKETAGVLDICLNPEIFEKKLLYISDLVKYFNTEKGLDFKEFLLGNHTFSEDFSSFHVEEIKNITTILLEKKRSTELMDIVNQNYWDIEYIGKLKFDEKKILDAAKRQEFIQAIEQSFLSTNKAYEMTKKLIDRQQYFFEIYQSLFTNQKVVLKNFLISEGNKEYCFKYEFTYQKIDDITAFFKAHLNREVIDLEKAIQNVEPDPNATVKPNTGVNPNVGVDSKPVTKPGA